MKCISCRVFLLLFVTLVSLVLSPDLNVEAKWRRRCCYPTTQTWCQAPTSTGLVCPMYQWMNHGYYYSYYSMMWDTCQAVSYDSTASLPSASGCDSNHDGLEPASKTNCLPSTFLGRVPPDKHPGEKGYGYGYGAPNQPRVDKLDNPFPSAGTAILNITGVSQIFKFTHPSRGTDLYVQIFIADVSPKNTTSDYPSIIVGHLSRGTEVNPCAVDRVYSGTDALKPVPNVPYAYTFSYLGFDIPVVLHCASGPHLN